MNKIKKSKYLIGMFGIIGCLAAFQLQAAQASSSGNNEPSAGKTIPLTTGTGVELGISASHYNYKEDTVEEPDFMHASGQRFDLLLDGHMTFKNEYFVEAKLKLGSSRLDYSGSGGSGTATDLKDRVSDIRFLVGKDFLSDADPQYRPFSLSPYLGLGSRNLFDDARGMSSTGATGYRRDSQYIYLPIGVSIRFRVANDARITTMLEYDQLLRGWQKTYLSDADPRLPEIVNTQHKGHGLRGSIVFENQNWSFGPVFEQWHVGKSDPDIYGLGYEPNNHTSEYGLKAAYRF